MNNIIISDCAYCKNLLTCNSTKQEILAQMYDTIEPLLNDEITHDFTVTIKCYSYKEI